MHLSWKVFLLVMLPLTTLIEAFVDPPKEAVPKGSELIFVHIAKTAGTTFRSIINKYGKFGVEHTENCYKALVNDFKERYKREGTKPFVVTFFRAPRPHVQSMYLECKYDHWGKSVTRKTKFPRSHNDVSDFTAWVNHFYWSWNRVDDAKEREIELECFHCYHPYNFQTRHMTNNCSTIHYRAHYLYEYDDPKYQIDEAIKNMGKIDFVGIVELYDASVCLFWLKTGQKENIIEFCFNLFREEIEGETHLVPRHSIKDVPTSIWKKVDEMTKYDLKLYRHAVDRFLSDWDEFATPYHLDLCHFKFHKVNFYSALDTADKGAREIMFKLDKC